MEEGNSTNSPPSELLESVRKQMEFYFSKDNLMTDSFLISQMDINKSVAISVVMKFPKMEALTTDERVVIKALENSTICSVEGGRVRGSLKATNRSTLILRDIPSNTSEADVREIFNFDSCRPISSMRSDIGDTWYVLFESEDDAKHTLAELKTLKRTFNGQVIKGRVKSETILKGSSYYTQSSAGPQIGIPLGISPFAFPGGAIPMPMAYPAYGVNMGATQPFSDVDNTGKPRAPGSGTDATKATSPTAASNGASARPRPNGAVAPGQAPAIAAVRPNGTVGGPKPVKGDAKANSAPTSGLPVAGAVTANIAEKRNNRDVKKSVTPRAGADGSEPFFNNNLADFPALPNEGPGAPAATAIAQKSYLKFTQEDIVNIAKPYLNGADNKAALESVGLQATQTRNEQTVQQMKDLTLVADNAGAAVSESSRPAAQKVGEPGSGDGYKNSVKLHNPKVIESAAVQPASTAAPTSGKTVPVPAETAPTKSQPPAGSWAGVLLSGNMTPTATDPKVVKKVSVADKSSNTSGPSSPGRDGKASAVDERKGKKEKDKTDVDSVGKSKQKNAFSGKTEGGSSSRRGKDGSQEDDDESVPEEIPSPSSWGGKFTFAQILKVPPANNQTATASQLPPQTESASSKEMSSQTSPGSETKTTSGTDNEGDKQKSKAAAMSNAWRKESIANQKPPSDSR